MGKFLSISLRNSFPKLVFRVAQYGGLYQSTFRCLHFFVPLFSLSCTLLYVSVGACPLFFSARSYVGFALSNISLLDEIALSLLFTVVFSCLVIAGGWFESL